MDTARKKKGIRYRGIGDMSLVFIVLFLAIFGLVMIYSASAFSAVRAGRASTYYMMKQLNF